MTSYFPGQNERMYRVSDMPQVLNMFLLYSVCKNYCNS
jgi:hypothetical protein